MDQIENINKGAGIIDGMLWRGQPLAVVTTKKLFEVVKLRWVLFASGKI